jgi:hypothetical protein
MPSNELILSFSHRPLSKRAIDQLTDETKDIFFEIDKRLTSELAQELSHEGSEGNPVIHVQVTGAPYLYKGKAGRTLDWEETTWTEGEKVLSKIIEKIGLNRFHRIAKAGEVQVKGRLVDVKQSDFENVYEPEERRKEELTWIAKYVQNELLLVHARRVKRAVLLYPVCSDADSVDYHQDTFEATIKDIFEREWNTKENGPLNDIEIEVKLLRVENYETEQAQSPERKPLKKQPSLDPDESLGQFSLSGTFVRTTSME